MKVTSTYPLLIFPALLSPFIGNAQESKPTELSAEMVVAGSHNADALCMDIRRLH